MKAAFAMTPGLQHRFFDDDLMHELTTLVDLDPDVAIDDFAGCTIDLADVEVLVTAWGCPVLDEQVIARMPRLRAMVHAAGSVKHLVTPAVWERKVRVTTGTALNAQPVAEFTLGAVLWGGKHVLALAEDFRAERAARDLTMDTSIPGNYRQTVGVLGASAIGRKLIELLQPFDLAVLVSDPTIDAGQAGAMGAELVPLDELFARSTVVTVHAPLLPETTHLVDADLLARLPDGATIVNTARGGVIDHDALRAELVTGRLMAILDVTEPEPLAPDDPLWDLPNVTLTPHVAGSQGAELLRLGRAAVNEVRALTEGRPPLRPLDAAALAASA